MTEKNRGRVVIVDDDCEVSLSLQGIIELSGYEAYTWERSQWTALTVKAHDVHHYAAGKWHVKCFQASRVIYCRIIDDPT
jgi:hypothetical protein